MGKECDCYVKEVVFTYPEGQSGIKPQIIYCPLHKTAPKMAEALKEISEGKGRFSMDQLKHAENTIEAMKARALEVIAEIGGE